jgi:ubiquinone/menaquinone biosynthesis C-methylase UbiE
MVDERSKSELRSTWESAAPGWAKWEKVFAAGLTEVTDVLVDMAGIMPGQRVLDLACGAGSQSMLAAKRVGPRGCVVATDISGTMLEHVRHNAKTEGLENIETIESPAEDLEISQHPFDAAICRLGLMLFPAPGSALKAIQRVLDPGARFAALVFTTPANNPFMAQPMRILLRHADKQPPGPGQPGIFALGGDGVLANLLNTSGLTDVDTRTVRAVLKLPSTSQALEMMQQAFGAYRAVVADLGEAERSKAWLEVHECLKQFETAAGFETEFQFIIGSGARR